MNNLPKDPVMLLSYINTQLRDNYPCLSDFCSSQNVEMDTVINTLASIDYHYNETLNKFV